jgi:hypothetical protein
MPKWMRRPVKTGPMGLSMKWPKGQAARRVDLAPAHAQSRLINEELA